MLPRSGADLQESLGAISKVDTRELHTLLLRQRISNMFRRYVPTKLHRLDIALLRYHGKEEALLRSLVSKFGAEPPFSAEQQRLNDMLSEAIAPNRKRRDSCDAVHASPSQDQSEMGPDRCHPSPRGGDKFPAAVAIVAHHHQLRTRLFEAYSTKRTLIRMQEEKEREAVQRLLAIEHRHLVSVMTRKQAELLVTQQKERATAYEAQAQQRRQLEARVAWTHAQAVAMMQRATVKREETLSQERQERRVLTRQFNEERVQQFRHEKKVARLRDAAELEARRVDMESRVSGTVSPNERAATCVNTPTSFMHQLEEVLATSPLSASVVVAPKAAFKVSRREWASPERCDEMLSGLMDQLGTAVSFSVGSRPALPAVSNTSPRRSPRERDGPRHWAPPPLPTVISPKAKEVSHARGQWLLSGLPAPHSSDTKLPFIDRRVRPHGAWQGPVTSSGHDCE